MNLQRELRRGPLPKPLPLPTQDSEYLVNIGEGRRAAQKRVTGGRWRRIVLGHVQDSNRRDSHYSTRKQAHQRAARARCPGAPSLN